MNAVLCLIMISCTYIALAEPCCLSAQVVNALGKGLMGLLGISSGSKQREMREKERERVLQQQREREEQERRDAAQRAAYGTGRGGEKVRVAVHGRQVPNERDDVPTASMMVSQLLSVASMATYWQLQQHVVVVCGCICSCGSSLCQVWPTLLPQSGCMSLCQRCGWQSNCASAQSCTAVTICLVASFNEKLE